MDACHDLRHRSRCRSGCIPGARGELHPPRLRGCRRTFPLSSDSLHDLLLQLHQCGSAGRPHLNFIQALLAMAMAKLHLGLGYTSVAIYAEKNFGCRPFQTYDYLKIARALTYLPLCNQAYLDGTIGWPELRLIALVASGLNEKKWIEFAATHSLPDLESDGKSLR
jgi:hypothetical protein